MPLNASSRLINVQMFVAYLGALLLLHRMPASVIRLALFRSHLVLVWETLQYI